jgi:hypothetical protein
MQSEYWTSYRKDTKAVKDVMSVSALSFTFFPISLYINIYQIFQTFSQRPASLYFDKTSLVGNILSFAMIVAAVRRVHSQAQGVFCKRSSENWSKSSYAPTTPTRQHMGALRAATQSSLPRLAQSPKPSGAV